MEKPQKPKGSPLFPHRNGQWCKKIRGKQHYFGVWADYGAALANYHATADDLLAGREIRQADPGTLTVSDLCNLYLAGQQLLVDTGELHPRSWQAGFKACERLCERFGRDRLIDSIGVAEWAAYRAALAARYAPTSLSVEVSRIKAVAKWGYDAGILESPLRLGTSFSTAGMRAVRRARREKREAHGPRMFEASELRKLIDSAKQPLKAMIWLAINGAFGQSDLSAMPRSAIGSEWVDYPRPKTEVERRCPLWPETAEALADWHPQRPDPVSPTDAGLLFVTSRGNRYVTFRNNHSDKLGYNFRSLLRRLDLYRPGCNFYAIRHTFETIGRTAGDQVALNAIMGHVDQSISAMYRERIDDAALKHVCDTVRTWLLNT